MKLSWDNKILWTAVSNYPAMSSASQRGGALFMVGALNYMNKKTLLFSSPAGYMIHVLSPEPASRLSKLNANQPWECWTIHGR